MFSSLHYALFIGIDDIVKCLVEVIALPADLSPDFQNQPFLEYCLVYRGVHAKRGLSDCAISLALKLLMGYYGRR